MVVALLLILIGVELTVYHGITLEIVKGITPVLLSQVAPVMAWIRQYSTLFHNESSFSTITNCLHYLSTHFWLVLETLHCDISAQAQICIYFRVPSGYILIRSLISNSS